MSQGSYLMKNTNVVIRINHWQARSLALYQTVRSELEGIEQYYNSTLSGVDGRKYKYLNEELEQDSSIVEPENGKTVVTTIDSNIQKLAEDQLSKFEKKYGSKEAAFL